MWFYMSFATDDEFLGGCYIEADSLPEAITYTHKQEINPGGELLVFEVSTEDINNHVPEDARDRLLTKAELVALDELEGGS